MVNSLSVQCRVSSDVLLSVLQKEINMKSGLVGKQAALKRFISDAGCGDFVTMQAETIYRYIPVSQNDVVVKLSGRANALFFNSSGTISIIHVRQRQNGLTKKLEAFEQVQLQMYMWLYGAKEAHFQEQYYEEKWSTTVQADLEFQLQIKDKIVQFILDYVGGSKMV